MTFERVNDGNTAYAETVCRASDFCSMLDSCDLCPFVGTKKCVYMDEGWPNSQVYNRYIKVKVIAEETEG